MITVREATAADLPAIWEVYAACRRADPAYLPFLSPEDTAGIAAWFLLKPTVALLVAEADGAPVGVAGLRDAAPGPSASGVADRPGRWLEACRLAVHPGWRGGEVTRRLTATRLDRARDLGADRLFLRCVAGSPAHQLYLRLGWTFWSETTFTGDAACQHAVYLALRL